MYLRSSEEYQFLPPRRGSTLINLGWMFFLIGGGALGLYQASQAQIGPVFMLWLLPGLVAVIAAPMLAYQLYCLRTAYYIIERDGLRLRWGLRIEQIPMTAIIWVHTQDELVTPLPKPVLRYWGSVVGVRQLSGIAGQAGPKQVEYLASRASNLVLVGAAERIFAISPKDVEGFLFTFQRLAELGSLTPVQAQSVYPTFLINRVWLAWPARLLLITSLILSLVLFIWVGLAIQTRSQIHLGFYPDGAPGDLAPAVQLLLLPVINSIIVLADFLVGLFFFRREETQELSFLMWSSSAITAVLFLVGAFFILRTA